MPTRRRRGASPSPPPPDREEKEPCEEEVPAAAVVPPALSLRAAAATCSAHSWALVLVTLLACTTRLWRLDHPGTPVYDETHVGRFLNWYHDRAFFFDVHPPLAKLLMLWVGGRLGFAGRQTCPYESASPYAASCELHAQRLVPAVCGAALVPLALLSARAMGLHPFAVGLAGWFVLVDTLWIGLSRVHLNDMVQMLFIALTHYCALLSADPADASIRYTPRKLALLVATGVSLGCALQCKFAMALTTLAWLGLQAASPPLRTTAQPA